MSRNIKVLFVGNSHTYMNDMPALFSHIYEKTDGGHAECVMLAYSGRDWQWHRKEYLSLRYNLLYGQYDYCILQQAAHPFPPKETTMENGRAIIELCQKVHTIPVLAMTWAEKAYPENQQKMIDTYTQLAAETGALLSPAGIVWQDVQRTCPAIDLYYRDGEHASPYGDLLIAMCHVCTICRMTPQLPDHILDFQVEFPGEGGFPHALEDPAQVRIPYDRALGESIRKAVIQHCL